MAVNCAMREEPRHPTSPPFIYHVSSVEKTSNTRLHFVHLNRHDYYTFNCSNSSTACSVFRTSCASVALTQVCRTEQVPPELLGHHPILGLQTGLSTVGRRRGRVRRGRESLGGGRERVRRGKGWGVRGRGSRSRVVDTK